MIEAARREARELDHGWIGVEHVLLALAREESVASDALAAANASHAALRDWFAHMEHDPDLAPPPQWSDAAKPTPRLQTMADALGSAPPTAWLIAILAEPMSLAAAALEKGARGREAVAEALRARGIAVGELPPLPWWLPHGNPIYVPADRLMDVVRVASREVGVGFGFNTTRDGRGRVSAPLDVDLQAIVDRVLRDA